jgi:predicted O-methyltransferase YrrM
MEIVNKEIERYCLEHSENEPDILKQINRDTHANFLKPRMLSGHLQGRFLSFISQLINPEFILEIGTYTGYSALCLAEGLKTGGKLFTIEANEELESIIRKNISLAKKNESIELILGQAHEEINKIPHNFDLVFIDADKHNYERYYDLILEKVKVGGVIITDNVLWDGKVADLTKNDATTLALRKFNKKLKEDNRTQQVLLPIRDGLFVSRKIK